MEQPTQNWNGHGESDCLTERKPGAGVFSDAFAKGRFESRTWDLALAEASVWRSPLRIKRDATIASCDGVVARYSFLLKESLSTLLFGREGSLFFGRLVRVHLLAVVQIFGPPRDCFLQSRFFAAGFLVSSKIEEAQRSSLTIASIRTAESRDRFFQQKFFQVGKAANPQQVCCLLSTPVWSCERWTDRVVSWCSCEDSIGTSLS